MITLTLEKNTPSNIIRAAESFISEVAVLKEREENNATQMPLPFQGSYKEQDAQAKLGSTSSDREERPEQTTSVETPGTQVQTAPAETPVQQGDEEESPVDKPVPSSPSVDTQEIELDAEGLPWDERIHAGSGAKLKDGTWRKRRGVEDETVEQVEAELRRKVYGGDEVSSDVTPRSFSEFSSLLMDVLQSHPDSTDSILAIVNSQGFDTVPDLEKASSVEIGVVYDHVEAQFRPDDQE